MYFFIIDNKYVALLSNTRNQHALHYSFLFMHCLFNVANFASVVACQTCAMPVSCCHVTYNHIN